ncbi:Sec-independent protein translocase protein TatB [Thermomonas flagellata]|uniref:Sec-independent protein translocase protein TatB n=1 Tax=Thermomonas flagellata TaxID=2888524 RepID=UPI001F04E164|nr:Sec-independent protein translocase protein TatB [Thermomonas flagellata]
MFDLSFGELLVIALVALVVLGPERLPKAARMAGLWARKARAHWHAVKDELERELAAEELKRSLQDGRRAFSEAEQALREAGEQAAQRLQPPTADTASAPPPTPALGRGLGRAYDDPDDAAAEPPTPADSSPPASVPLSPAATSAPPPAAVPAHEARDG